MGLLDPTLKGKFMRKPIATLEAVVEKARSYEAVKAVTENVGTTEPLSCLAVAPNNTRQTVNRPVIDPLNCPYCRRFGRRAQHCGHNPPTNA